MVGLDTQLTGLRGLNTAINTLGPQRFSLGTGGGVLGPYLPTVATSPSWVSAAKRVVQNYAGPLFQLQRASDNATMDFYPRTGSDLPDYAAIGTWIGASTAFYSAWYEQSGTGLAATQTVTANGVNYTRLYDLAGCAPLNFAANANTGVPKWLVLPNAVSLNQQAMSSFLVLAPQSSMVSEVYFSLTNLAGTANQMASGQGTTGYYTVPGTSALTNIYPRAMPQVVSAVTAAFTTKVTCRETTSSASVGVSSALTQGGYIGRNFAGNQSLAGNMFAFLLYPSALSDADAASIRTALTQTFSIPTSFTSRLAYQGDSISAAFGVANLYGYQQQINILPGVELFNFAIPGETAATADTNYAARAGSVITNSIPCYFSLFEGTNDVFIAGSTGAATYTSQTSLLNKAKASGALKTLISTILPRTDANTSHQTERTNDNALILANSAGADSVVNTGADPRLQNPADTTVYQDGTHPTALGDSYVASNFRVPLVAWGLAS